MISGILASAMVLGMTACGDSSTASSESNSNSASSSNSVSSTVESSSTVASGSEAVPTEEPGPDMTPLSVSIALPADSTHTDENKWYDKLTAELAEYLQMDITWVWTESNTYYDSLALDIISGNVADVIISDKSATFIQAAEEGLFWDLTDYIKDYDNFVAIPEATLANASYNGKVYGIPRSRTLARHGLGYRVDWLNNLGLKEPTDWASFVDMLYAFTYSDPDGNGVDDTVGLCLDSWTGAWNIMLMWFGVPNEWGIDKNGDLIYKAMTEEYKTALAAFRELYAQGLINNGSNGISHFMEVRPGKAMTECLRAQLGGCGVQTLGDLRKVQTYFEDQGLTAEGDIIFTLQSAVDTGFGTKIYPTSGMGNMIAISTKTIKTEDQLRRVLQMLNDMNDGECLNLVEYGWEGLTYGLNADGYVELYEADALAASGVGSMGYANGFNQMFAYFTAESNARPVIKAPSTSVITQLENKLYEENIPYCVTNYGISYTSNTYADNGTALDEIIATAQLEYITGEIDEAGLDEAIKRWWSAGGEQVTKEMNDLYHAAGN